MNRLKHFFMIATAIIVCGAPMSADDYFPSIDGGNSNTPIYFNPKSPNNRPKAPSKQHIECWYLDGELSFDFVIPEGECTLYVTDYATGFMTQYTFDSSDHADVYVGTLPNGGALEINTESGHTYTGSF